MMRIDWNETLVGAEGAASEAATRASTRALATLRLGRLAGIAGAASLVAIAFLSLSGGFAGAQPFFMAAAGLLLANVLGFLALDRLGNRGIIAAFIAACSGLLPTATLSIPAVIGMIAILACEWLWQREATRSRHDLLIGIAVAAVGAGGMAVITSGAALFPTLLIAASLLPLIFCSARFQILRRHSDAERVQDEIARRAFVEFALARLPKRQVMVDASGRIVTIGAHAPFQRHLAQEEDQGGNLVDRVLIADRPKVLQALSDAVHKPGPPRMVIARMQEPGGDTPLAPPVYVAQRLQIGAAPGIAERVIVLIEPAERRQRRASETIKVEGPSGTMVEALRRSAPDAELLARALHDSVSPFNAGLGYLEMIADPRLAPQDVTAYRQYAREAMVAIREAHRNASLMGRWLKLDAAPAQARRDCSTFGELAGDAIRVMHPGVEVTGVEVRVDGQSSALALSLSLDRARFALSIYLRGVLAQAGKASRVTVHARFEGADLRIVSLVEPAPKARKTGDMFQHALERIALKTGDMRFETGSDGSPSLVLADAMAPQGASPAFSRLAS